MVHVKFPAGDDGDRHPRRRSNAGAARASSCRTWARRAREFQIRVHGAEEGGSAQAADAIRARPQRRSSARALTTSCASRRSGRRSDSDLWWDATLAVLFATLVMGSYIAFRFDWRFGVGAAVALMHDVLMTVGALSHRPAWSST